MIAVPSSLGRPLTPATNTPAPIRHRPRTSFEDSLVRRLQAIRQGDRLGATALTSSCARPVRTSPGTDRSRDPDSPSVHARWG